LNANRRVSLARAVPALFQDAMREFEVVVTLPSDAQTALRVLYGDASFFSGYHARVGDASTSVSAWDAATRTRTVCFQKRMDIPAPIARVLGARPPALRSVCC